MNNPFSRLFRARDKPRSAFSAASSFYFGTSSAGKSVTVFTAIQMSTVYASVKKPQSLRFTEGKVSVIVAFP